MDKWKIAVVGDGGVGKTALSVQVSRPSSTALYGPYFVAVYAQLLCGLGTICRNLETYDPTIEDSYRKQTVLDRRMCCIEVIDTAGQAEEFSTLRDLWIRQAQGFILVYSVASRDSFDRIDGFRRSLYSDTNKRPVFSLAGNQADKVGEREVSRADGEDLARSYGCKYVETSAKTGKNVEGVFFDLARRLRLLKELEERSTSEPGKLTKLKPFRRCIIM
ncbi:hypothetical protein VNI00_006297 [Paramarasmius palmivorus]|uniref:Uncharacterized protein n=1 Tax=Paramarasmius palmivorus TaxID=297713 RepID=A0AAW0D9L8_9AGAR